MPGFGAGVRSELLFRAVNERIFELGRNEEEALEILCECGDESCISTVVITVREYEQVRLEPSRFVVRDGHELADIERVIVRTPEYLVVEKAGSRRPDRPQSARVAARSSTAARSALT